MQEIRNNIAAIILLLLIYTDDHILPADRICHFLQTLLIIQLKILCLLGYQIITEGGCHILLDLLCPV